MEEELQLPDSSQQDETFDDLGNHIEESEVDIEKLVETNKRLFARAKKAEEELKSYKPKEKPEAKEKPSEELQFTDLKTREVLELRAEGYSDAEILQLHEQASRFGTPISKLKDNPLIKEGMEALRKKAKAAQATPAPSSRSSSLSLKGKSYGELKTDTERREAFNSMIRGKSRNDSE